MIEMKWNEMKWNEMKWNEMKWNEMKWNKIKWVCQTHNQTYWGGLATLSQTVGSLLRSSWLVEKWIGYWKNGFDKFPILTTNILQNNKLKGMIGGQRK